MSVPRRNIACIAQHKAANGSMLGLQIYNSTVELS